MIQAPRCCNLAIPIFCHSCRLYNPPGPLSCCLCCCPHNTEVPSHARLLQERIQRPFEAKVWEARARLVQLLQSVMVRAAKSQLRSLPPLNRSVRIARPPISCHCSLSANPGMVLNAYRLTQRLQTNVSTQERHAFSAHLITHAS